MPSASSRYATLFGLDAIRRLYLRNWTSCQSPLKFRERQAKIDIRQPLEQEFVRIGCIDASGTQTVDCERQAVISQYVVASRISLGSQDKVLQHCRLRRR